jgi:hypothetical protein
MPGPGLGLIELVERRVIHRSGTIQTFSVPHWLAKESSLRSGLVDTLAARWDSEPYLRRKPTFARSKLSARVA